MGVVVELVVKRRMKLSQELLPNHLFSVN